MGEGEIDLESRELCPDGSCTGVVGSDGRCRECGRSADAAAAHQPAAPENSANGGTEPDPQFDEDRQLCADGNCTGLVGFDRRCKLCGLSATEALST